MNPFIVDSVPKRVNPLLGSIDENFEWDASIKLHWPRGRSVDRGNFHRVLLHATGRISSYHQGNLVVSFLLFR
jgi:hypothetical protein